jgi:hypothetical protein
MSEVLERAVIDLREELKRHVAFTQVMLKTLREELEKRITDLTRITEQFAKTIEELKKHRTVIEEPILENYALRDTAWHYTDFAAIGDYDIYAFQIRNETDQPLTCQIMGNRLKTTIGAASLGDTFTVNPGDSEIRTLSVYLGKWAPYAYIAFKADTAPSKGLVHAVAMKRVG